MKKTLLSLSLVALVAFAVAAVTAGKAVQRSAESSIKSKEICVGDKQNGAKSNYGRDENNIGPIAGYYSTYFSQSLYTTADLKLDDSGLINLTKITYAVEKGYEPKTFKVEVYVGETEVSELASSSPVQLEGQTKVFDGDWAMPMGKSTIEVPFSEPFLYDTSKNLVVTVIKKNSDASYAISWQWFDTPSGHKQYVQGGSVDRSYLAADDSYYSLPVMTLYYSTETEVSILDLAATALNLPAGFEEGKPARVTVDVTNRGTVAVAPYTVELFDVTNAEAPVSLGSTTVTDSLASQDVKHVTMDVTFANKGIYKLQAAVTAEGDSDTANNLTEPVSIEVSMQKPEGTRSQDLNQWETWIEIINGNEVVQGKNVSYFIPGNGLCSFAAAQFIYPASSVDMVRSGQIYSLSFYLQKFQYSSAAPMHYKVYLGTTDQLDYEGSGIVLSNQTLVYEGDKSFVKPAEGEEWKINFHQPFAYDNTKNLVVTVISEIPADVMGSPAPFVHSNNSSATRVALSSTTKSGFFGTTAYRNYMLPIASIEYVLDPLPQFVDVAVSNFAESTAFSTDTRKATYAATLTNLGTLDVEGFTVEIVNVLEDGSVEVVGSRDYDRVLGAEATFNAKVPVTFDTPGTYNLAARVEVAGDTNPDNNLSPERIQLVIEDNSGLGNLTAGKLGMADGCLVVGAEVSSVAVYDAAGRQVLTIAANGRKTVPLNLNAGIYTVIARSTDGTAAVLKVVL